MSIEPKEKYIFTHPKDEDGSDVLFRFYLTLGKRLSDKTSDKSGAIGEVLMKRLVNVDGIEFVNVGNGFYSLEVMIARTFDPQEVIDAIKEILDDVLSDIITPRLVTP